MSNEKIKAIAKKDAKKGSYNPSEYAGYERVLYSITYLGTREKMGLLQVAGPRK